MGFAATAKALGKLSHSLDYAELLLALSFVQDQETSQMVHSIPKCSTTLLAEFKGIQKIKLLS